MATFPVEATSMTPTEIEVWQTVVAMNRAWTSGHPEQLAGYFHEKMVAITPAGGHRLEGREACIAAWTAFVEQAKIVSWVERDPLVTVFGEAAVVTYYYDAAVEMGGKRQTLAGRDMFFMVKEDGRWWAVADQFSGMPGGQST
jgi:uncharacterized protein (TIGR02246 family)